MRIRLTTKNTVGMSSNRLLEDEVWSQLEYLHTVVEAREKFLKTKGFKKQSDINKIGREFSAYLTQAKNFYQHAKNSDYRSAALLYYYSFLNIAKALIIINNPKLSGSKFVHGLQRVTKKGDLTELSIQLGNVKGYNVNTFDEFYNVIYGNYYVRNEEISLLDLFSYCSDVAQEYEDLAGKPNRISYAAYVIALDSGTKKSWNKIAINGWHKNTLYPNTFSDFQSKYTKINVPGLYRQTQFKIEGMAYGITFFEANKEFDFIGGEGIDWYSCRNELESTLKGLYQTSIYNTDDINFELLAPVDDSSDMRHNELSSIYVAMYYLSEIVRYNPELFDGQMNVKTANGWLLKGFIEQAPVTFLYRILSLFKDSEVLYEHRH